MSIDPSHGGSLFLPPMPPREAGRAADAESLVRTVGNAVNGYNSHLDSIASQWVDLLSQEAPSMAKVVELQQTMHHASFYQHAAQQVERAFSDLVMNLVVRG